MTKSEREDDTPPNHGGVIFPEGDHQDKRPKLGGGDDVTPEKGSKLGEGGCNCSNMEEDDDDNDYLLYKEGDVQEFVPDGALVADYPKFKPYWSRYGRQLDDSKCFDMDDYPGASLEAPIVPLFHFKNKLDELMELANLGIQQYQKDTDFEYQVLKIEKVNYMLTGYRQYWMTVKVLNTTLVTTIETFQIHVATIRALGEKEVLLCQPKVKV